jgi:hypothetical protein
MFSRKINMVISNNNNSLPSHIRQMRAINDANLALAVKAPTSLSAPIISRIHNVKPGCGGCGRH